jgi:murein DD-endopeptidase MepM/ murein hydrolase activator NlpD
MNKIILWVLIALFACLTGCGNTAVDNSISKEDAYYLPYEVGKSFMLSQGYNGTFSHTGNKQYSLDFLMPVGTAVCAAREGTVSGVKEDSNSGGADESFTNLANYITIQHGDGTFADYLHLQQAGSIVAVGDHVTKGQVIGYSGNTGWSTAPHLHFMVFNLVGTVHQSIPVAMLTEFGPSTSLNEFTFYKSVRN